MPITTGIEPGSWGRLELAVHGLAIQVALIIFLVGLQGIILVLEHHLSNAWGMHVNPIQGAHHAAQFLNKECMYMYGVGEASMRIYYTLNQVHTN